ncbi:complement regulator-acquiring protein [Borreliella valaisiana]|uniref:complement regulator-acquiring protein n=1 Tax=Borreliella valaisiana TaxID=62088 RepID=UPI001B3482E4|nr:complement regulator-acquiring protein [Borreliella valaisiana]
MTNTKLNIIKLNIITAILTLICISCAPDNQINPDLSSNTNLEKFGQHFKDRSHGSQDPGHSHQEYQEYQDLKIEIEKYKGNKASQLKAIKNHLEKQKKKEDIEIAKIDAEITKTSTQSDFLKTFTASSFYANPEKDLLAMKRIIYSSLYYNTTRVKTLNEILEKLNTSSENKKVVTNLLYKVALGIQLQLELCLENITKDESHSPNQRTEELLEFARNDLNRKDRFVKVLNKTINDYNRNAGGIKTNVEKLASYMDEKFKALE